MSGQLTRSAVVFASIVLSGCFIAYRNRILLTRHVHDCYEKFTASPEKLITLKRIHNLKEAVRVLQNNVTQLFSLFSSSGNGHSNISPELKKGLAELSSDIDYLYGELDQIRGDESIVRQRKAIVEEVNCVSKKADAWFAELL